MAASKYFDPRARVAAEVAPPPPRAVSFPAPVPNAVYWNERTSRRPSVYPSEAEILAAFDGLDAPTRATLEGFVSLAEHEPKGETALELFSRRVRLVPRCQYCRGVGGEDGSHRKGCRIVTEWDIRFNKWWLRRRRQKDDGAEVEEDIEEVSPEFPFRLGVTD